MPIIIIVVVIATLGLIVWDIVTYIPMPDILKKIIIAVVAIATLLWSVTGGGPLSLSDCCSGIMVKSVLRKRLERAQIKLPPSP